MLKNVVPYIFIFLSIATIHAFSFCPEMCYCILDFIDCKYNKLTELPNGLYLNVSSLDLSHNNFKEFPENLKSFKNLRYLNFSYNDISTLDYSAMEGLSSLEQLDFSHNLFSDWIDVRTTAFSATTNLIFLDFSHNPLRNLPLHPFGIPSLEILKLNNCSMRNLNENILLTMPNLKELHVAQNTIHTLNLTFKSSSLKFFDLSECNLKFIHDLAFDGLTFLETIRLQKNNFLKKFNCASNSLLYVDLSNCNLEAIPNNYLNKVYYANFHGNHFRTIPKHSFENFTSLIHLDLSYNAISSIETEAFDGLSNIESIDLSFNTLTTLGVNLFESNNQLKKLNLSHNYFSKLEKFSIQTLQVLDLSSNEIHIIKRDSLNEMPQLKKLNLSKNIISHLPNNLESSNLSYLDLSFCHITALNNKTFDSIPSLRYLNIAGNRLTSVSPNYFNQVIYIEIYDNPWRCDCPTLRAMYVWLSQTSKRLDKLLCQSPEKFEGLSWFTACRIEWHPDLYKRDSVWYYSVGLIVAMFILLVVILILRRVVELKEKRLREAEANRRAEERETLQRMRRIQAEAIEENARNAPDPRELQRPPSYHEALLLPKLDSSHPSLAGSLPNVASKHIGSNPDIYKSRSRRKRRRRKSLENPRASRREDSENSEPELTHNRTTLESDF